MSVYIEDAFQHVRFSGRQTSPVLAHTKGVRTLSSCAGNDSFDQSQKSELISSVLKLADLNPDDYRIRPLLRRLPACLRALHVDTEACAVQLLEKHPDLLSKAVDSLLIGVTEFFRDPEVFEDLRTEVLPRLAANNRMLRIWSAGCSNGAELYSMAILLAQAGMLDGSYLLGTDCRVEAIKRARNSIYDLNQMQNVKLPDQCVFFTRDAGGCRPIEMLARNIDWRVADVIHGLEQGPWDIILWRNMAIYMKTETVEHIWKGLISSLSPEGVLVVGRAERAPSSLPLLQYRRCIYRLYSAADPTTKIQHRQAFHKVWDMPEEFA